MLTIATKTKNLKLNYDNFSRRDHSLDEDEFDWLEVAQREKIHLECPFCSNIFQKEGFR